jgi:hypothetical protein
MTRAAKDEIDRQLPRGDEIFLDHVGHFVPDRQAASRALVRAGFAPTPLSIQVDPEGTSTGTGNICAMLTRGYIELLFKTAETPLAVELDAAIARYGGVHLAAFAVADAGKAHRRLDEAGFPMRPLAEMERAVDTATGRATAAFTLARAERGAMAEGRIQLLTHHTENAVWQKRWLAHPNGARALASIVIVVADVDEAAKRFARFTGRPATSTKSGRTIRLDRGRVELVTRSAFRAALSEVSIPSLPFMGAYGVVVQSLDTVELLFHKARLHTRRVGDVLLALFPPPLEYGAWLFSEKSQFTPFR